MDIQQLKTLRAVVENKGFQAGARHLHKTHPSVLTLIKNFEDELGFSLFDRSKYRATLTDDGRRFYERSIRVLEEMERLQQYSNQIRTLEETELNIVIGDVTPIGRILPCLKRFFQAHPGTQLNLLFENLRGPNDRLLAGEADLIVHHIDKTDTRYEYFPFLQVTIKPVAAPDFLVGQELNRLMYSDLESLTQCVVRDTSEHPDETSYHVMKNTPKVMVGDQYTKREVIRQGVAWGHMPDFLVEDDIDAGRLLALAGHHVRNHKIDIVIARRSDAEIGPIANNLWTLLKREIAVSFHSQQHE
ncbi:transcriptional regulator [Oleiphilus messinensis]|uniref:Transcriptional regulator n=1 Tax=Oleiphilus messinensis TaxID=141451 RepID=A0A1Y0IEM8_9GAMM|nr:LysR family transcriptional regulator [Oleiphilus messinensis]ARU58901.1 transcriptional regulator [Oleiphilus messinensis]